MKRKIMLSAILILSSLNTFGIDSSNPGKDKTVETLSPGSLISSSSGGELLDSPGERMVVGYCTGSPGIGKTSVRS